MDDFFEDLYRSEFVTPYASTSASEDFADTVAYVSIVNDLRSSITVKMPSGTIIDMTGKLREPWFATKARFIEERVVNGVLKTKYRFND